ncbi:glycosyltransferase [Vibrio sinaloensis]|uniref:glycosyltransferase n=1 Tax=Photobacterium sp. (strain ATCC 43367) TaxID=379097 RepID=UPI002F3EB1F6
MKKIFLTVGAQLPFDRLISFIDQSNFFNGDVITAQIGNSSYQPKNMIYKPFMNDKEYNSLLKESDVVISHAGMGTIIQCMELNKPLIVVPRRVEFNEHRNDHQLDTVKLFNENSSNGLLLRVCLEMDSIHDKVEELLANPNNYEIPKFDESSLVEFFNRRINS